MDAVTEIKKQMLLYDFTLFHNFKDLMTCLKSIFQGENSLFFDSINRNPKMGTHHGIVEFRRWFEITWSDQVLFDNFFI